MTCSRFSVFASEIVESFCTLYREDTDIIHNRNLNALICVTGLFSKTGWPNMFLVFDVQCPCNCSTLTTRYHWELHVPFLFRRFMLFKIIAGIPASLTDYSHLCVSVRVIAWESLYLLPPMYILIISWSFTCFTWSYVIFAIDTGFCKSLLLHPTIVVIFRMAFCD
jgi:hypothetical protein